MSYRAAVFEDALKQIEQEAAQALNEVQALGVYSHKSAIHMREVLDIIRSRAQDARKRED